MTRVAVTVVLLMLPILVAAQDSRSDFARGADIRAEGGSIFRVLVPDEVYETVTRADLGDVRVLNASGDAVPHMLRRAPQPAAADAAWVAVPAFPMRDEQTGRAGRTQVKIDSTGAVLEVTGGTVSAGPAAYLVDASAIRESVSRLALTWTAPAGVTFLTRVRVDGSSDLNAWRTLVGSVALAQLQRDGFTLIQSEIELPRVMERTRYLRISWPAELSGVSLATVRVRPRVTAQELPIHWRTLTGVPTNAASEVVYDANASFPVEYLDLDFVDAADAVDVALLSRRTPSAEWTFRHTGLFYALQEASGALRCAPARIGTDTDRYWSIRKNGSGGWATGRAPRLKIGWHPQELVFVAKGPPPYTLVYGSARVQAADAPVGELLASLDQADRSRQVREATVGSPRDLGGVTALTPSRDTRRLVLWSVLALAVAVLAWIAVRTFRDTAGSGLE